MYYIIVIIGMIACSFAQILLKKSANKSYKNFITTVLNWRVLTSYSIFFISIMINASAMSNGLSLKELPILESFSYIFVPILSWIFLNEKIYTTGILAIVIIICGIFIFYA